MPDRKQYVLDANVFIQAHRRHYAFDICPGFWDLLVRQHSARTVCSIDKVRDEIAAGQDGDELKKWVKDKQPLDGFFKGTADAAVLAAFRKMMNWVQAHPSFTQDAKSEFAGAADGWLVAYAAANGLAVVTHEELAPQIKKQVRIPNLCVQFGVEYLDTFKMLRELEAKLVLGK
ncbi:DUF4411 family protein [Planctellipticum variicoloris]|uniref:DUF4411 family protein n=1 Tax=Planctellipticum variicoloris TaxID=3064265 RepID=UPI00301329A5|nr:DUF4411 family protein [Planctomycetaceae bacterium SH412]